jgi:hypothetical protein
MTKRWLVALFLISGCTFALAASRAAEPRQPGPLAGTVTGPDGRPVAGVPLWAVISSDQWSRDRPLSAVSGPGRFQRKVYWIVEVPAGSAPTELDLDLATAKPVPEQP